MEAINIENIFPALCETPATQMSSKEFQRTLYSWFEERGLVTDLRSYLRVLMINELRNRTVGKIDSKTNFSLSKQAFSLLIAEHLLREGCHYTLSVFSTEVPAVANQLPFSLLEAHSHNEMWHFDEESLLNVLELIGVSKGSSESLRIASLYFKNKDSLLTCLVSSKSVAGPDLPIDNERDLVKILTVLGVPGNMADNIKKNIEEGFSHQIPQDRKNLEEIQNVLIERNRQIKLLLDEQILQKKDNKKVKCELKETRKRLKQALLKEQSLNLKETEIRKKLDEVTRLQRSLERTFSRGKVDVCSLKHCTESCQSIVSVNDELRNEIKQLEQDHKGKSREIQHLNAQIVSLTKDLHNAKSNIEFLNSCLLRSSQIGLQQGT